MADETITADENQIADVVVCLECGLPKGRQQYVNGSAVCKRCTPVVLKRAEMPISAEDRFRDRYEKQLAELRQTAQNQMVTGVHKGIDILGESPQEIMATMINEMRGNAPGQEELSPEMVAALPKDYKTIGHFLKMLQEAQTISDKQLSDAGNPFEQMSSDDLRAMMLKGATDHIKSDCELRLQVIRSFMDTIPTFLNEVMQVAGERERQSEAIEVS